MDIVGIERLLLAERFWDKVEETDTCWLWKAGKTGKKGNKGGYGQFYANGRTRYAHHIAYILANNLPIDSVLYLCHECDNPECVKPAHLKEGDDTVNARDMMARGRGRGQFQKGQKATGTPFPKGITPPMTLIDRNTANIIKVKLAENISATVIAADLGLSRNIIYNIKYGKTWK